MLVKLLLASWFPKNVWAKYCAEVLHCVASGYLSASCVSQPVCLCPIPHAMQHKAVPYCHVPCYSVLFGPTLFGHGSQVEAHTSFGKNTKDRQCVSSVPRYCAPGLPWPRWWAWWNAGRGTAKRINVFLLLRGQKFIRIKRSAFSFLMPFCPILTE